MERADLAIIGAGAAGLAAAIFAGEAMHTAGLPQRIVLLEGAKKPGAKILISGGGRCNVTNEKITPQDYAGGPRPLVRSVLRAFDERLALAWFGRLGVALKLEPTGKYFPVSDDAHTVLDALLRRVRQVGVEFWTGCRVRALDLSASSAKGDCSQAGTPVPGKNCVDDYRFRIAMTKGPDGARSELLARRVVVATGGLALPKSGSDGAGYGWLMKIGHTLVPTTPALVPLLLEAGSEPGGRFAELSGLTVQARLILLNENRQILAEQTGSLLFTHFGISGPAALDISRNYLRARLETPRAKVQLCLGHPDFENVEAAEVWLLRQTGEHPRAHPATRLAQLYPARLAQMLAENLPPFFQLRREQRRELARRLARLPLPIKGDRGYAFAEVTAGGIDLREVNIRTMESRRLPGIYLCGEILDVDGRIGGFNFQWAWATGYLAGRAAIK